MPDASAARLSADAPASETGRVLADLTERAARRCYGRLYPRLPWEDASDQGRAAAYSNMKAADVLAVVETDLVLARGLLAGATEVAPGAHKPSPPLASPPIIRGETEELIAGIPGLFPVGWWHP